MFLLNCIIFAPTALFYYVLGNLRPELRSTHKAIQLIACVSSENLSKYGYSRVLAPFIDDVNKLSKVCLDASIIVKFL